MNLYVLCRAAQNTNVVTPKGENINGKMKNPIDPLATFYPI